MALPADRLRLSQSAPVEPELAWAVDVDLGTQVRPKMLCKATPVVILLAGLLTACGGEMTMTEYVEAMDAIFDRGLERYETVIASPEGMVLIVGQGDHLGFGGGGLQLTDFTPHDLHVALEAVAEIQDEALRSAAAIDPPEQLEELHALYFRELPIAELAARAETASDWTELSASAEMAAYRTALEGDIAVCMEFQETLDEIAQRGAFTDVPWMPGELTEIVEYALGCSALPQNPQDAYRPPAGDSSTP